MARTLGQGSPKPLGHGGRTGAPVLGKGLPVGAPRPAQGGALEVPPHGGESGAQLPPGARRRAAAGPPAGTFLRHSPAPARRAAAASRGGRQRGACALTRSRPGPWALPGGWEVGTWEGAGPHTLPASRWRRRHLAARAPRDARRMSRPGKRAGTACGPVGGSPPQPAAPRDHRPPKLNLARRGPGAGSRGARPRGLRHPPRGALCSPEGARSGVAAEARAAELGLREPGTFGGAPGLASQ